MHLCTAPTHEPSDSATVCLPPCVLVRAMWLYTCALRPRTSPVFLLLFVCLPVCSYCSWSAFLCAGQSIVGVHLCTAPTHEPSDSATVCLPPCVLVLLLVCSPAYAHTAPCLSPCVYSYCSLSAFVFAHIACSRSNRWPRLGTCSTPTDIRHCGEARANCEARGILLQTAVDISS